MNTFTGILLQLPKYKCVLNYNKHLQNVQNQMRNCFPQHKAKTKIPLTWGSEADLKEINSYQ